MAASASIVSVRAIIMDRSNKRRGGAAVDSKADGAAGDDWRRGHGEGRRERRQDAGPDARRGHRDPRGAPPQGGGGLHRKLALAAAACEFGFLE